MNDRRHGWHLLLAVPVFILLIARLLPLLYCLVLSVTDHSMLTGLAGASWTGLANYARLGVGGQLFPALSNTLAQSLIPLLCGATLAVLAAAVVPRVRPASARAAILSAALLVSFVPAQAYTRLLYTTGAYRAPAAYNLAMILLNLLPGIGLAVFLGAAVACLAGRESGVLRQGGAVLYVLCGAASLLSTNLDAFHLLPGPANAGMTLAQMEYRYAFMQMDSALASATRMIANAVQLVPCALALFVMVTLLRRRANMPASVPGTRARIGAVVCIPIILGVALFLFGFAACLTAGEMGGRFAVSAVMTWALTALGSFFLLLVLVPGAAAATSFRTPVVPALLVFAGGLSGGMLAEYMLTQRLGGVNTILFPAFWSAMDALPLVACVAYLFYLGHRRATAYALPLVGLGVQSILTNLQQPLLYINDSSRYTLPLWIRVMENDFSAQSAGAIPLRALVLFALALWALSCAPLFAAAESPGGEG